MTMRLLVVLLAAFAVLPACTSPRPAKLAAPAPTEAPASQPYVDLAP